MSSPNVSSHLSFSGKVNLGSFYTPAKYVECVAEWLKAIGVDSHWVIADLSCGYGAFFELSAVAPFSQCTFIGNDVDKEAIREAGKMFPNVRFYESNSLADVSREKFGISPGAKLVIVGNPPYNDVTSQINQHIKKGDLDIDWDIRTRDLGLSSLLAYNKISAEYAAVLHPLSYLIKRANFSAGSRFFSNYRLLKHIVFSSQEFAGTSRMSAFPVIVALYERVKGWQRGLTYQDVLNIKFKTVEGDSFSVGGFDYVADEVKKYPHNGRYDPEILFYTMRDINALKRSRTFIKDRIPNAVDIDPRKFSYYCYIDCFKRYAKIPYWIGNLNVPYIKDKFCDIEKLVIRDSKYYHQDIFGSSNPISDSEKKAIVDYVDRVFSK